MTRRPYSSFQRVADADCAKARALGRESYLGWAIPAAEAGDIRREDVRELAKLRVDFLLHQAAGRGKFSPLRAWRLKGLEMCAEQGIDAAEMESGGGPSRALAGLPRGGAGKKPLFYEWSPNWKFVHETFVPASRCAEGQYRSRRSGTAQVVVCCPEGSKMDDRQRCCTRDGKCVEKPIKQSVRVPVGQFKREHPKLWIKMSRGKIDRKTNSVKVRP